MSEDDYTPDPIEAAVITFGSIQFEADCESLTATEGENEIDIDLNGVDLEDFAEFIGNLVRFFNARIETLNERIKEVPEMLMAADVKR